MKRSLVVCIVLTFLGVAILATSAVAQTKAYRQTNLASDAQNLANNVNRGLKDSWGVAFRRWTR